MASIDEKSAQNSTMPVSDQDNALIPGTTYLVDVLHNYTGAHGGKDVVLIPQPSDDPDDPLNWSQTRKYVAMIVMCLWAFMLGAVTLSPGVTYGALIPELETDVTTLNIGAAMALFNLGFFNIFFNPLSEKFGRRPVYIFSAFLTGISQVICAAAPNQGVWLFGRILLGAAAAPFEQLPAISVNDQFFVHERGFGLSLYIISIATGSFCGPIAMGFVVQSIGWRWVYGIYAIVMGTITIINYFFLEETAYPRHLAQPATLNESGKPLLRDTRKGFWAMRPLYSHVPMTRTFWEALISPFRVIHLPIILWCGIVYGAGVSWLTFMAVSAFTVFQGPTYQFSFGATGLTNISPMIGCLVSLYVGGAGTDRFLIWKARREGGMMKPEARLYVVFFGATVMCAGLLLYGLAAAHGLHWFVAVFGMALIGAGLPPCAETALNYSVESYPLIAGEVTVAVIVLRNCIIGCPLTFSVAPWIESSGLQGTFIGCAVLSFVAMSSGGILIIYGEKCRKSSAELYYKLSVGR